MRKETLSREDALVLFFRCYASSRPFIRKYCSLLLRPVSYFDGSYLTLLLVWLKHIFLFFLRLYIISNSDNLATAL